MTLIFSNENRILFNIESSDQLVKLAYGNRFNLLADSNVACNTKAQKKVAQQQSISFRAYRTKHASRNPNLVFFTKKNKRLKPFGKRRKDFSPYATEGGKRSFFKSMSTQIYDLCGAGNHATKDFRKEICTAAKREPSENKICKKAFALTSKPFFTINRNFKQILFDFVRTKSVTSLALESFSQIELLCLYDLLQDTNNETKPENAGKDDTKKSISNQVFLKKAFSTLARRYKAKSSILLQNSTLGFNQRLEQATKKKPKNFREFVSYLEGNTLVFIRDKVQFLEKKKVWWRSQVQSFASLPRPNFQFGTVEGMQYDLLHRPVRAQRARSALQHLSKSKSARHVRAQRALFNLERCCKAKLCTGLFDLERWKARTCWASIKIFVPRVKLWSFAFGTSFLVIIMTSIVQRQDQNRWFFIFSKNQLTGLHGTSQESSWESFENITLKYLNRKALFSKSLHSKGLLKAIDPYKEIWHLYFSELWNQQSLQNYTAIFSRRGTTFFKKSCAGAAGWLQGVQISDSYALHNEHLYGRWLCQPWYQLDARALPKKSNKLGNEQLDRGSWAEGAVGSLKHATKSKVKRYKERVTIEDDSIPLKMSCSTKGSNKDFIFSPNDIVKALFYKFVHFSIESGSFQRSSQDADSFDDLSFSCNEGVVDQDCLSFLQQENFFQTPDSVIPNQHKTSFSHPFYLGGVPTTSVEHRKKDNLQILVVGDQNDAKALQHEREQPSVPSSVETYANHVANKKVVSNLQNEYRSYHSCPQRVSKSFRPLFSTTKRSRLYKALPKICTSTSFGETNAKRKEPYKSTPERPGGYATKICVASGEGLARPTTDFSTTLELKSFVANQNFLLSEPTVVETLNRKLSKSPEKIAGYFLSKRNRISTRFMSGYQLPETKRFQVDLRKNGNKEGYLVLVKRLFTKRSDLSPKNHSIKIPPALPFYESKVKQASLPNTIGFRLEHTPHAMDKSTPFTPRTKLCFVKVPSRDVHASELKNGENKSRTGCARLHFRRALQHKSSNQIGSLKKIPYKKLSLNELDEVTPLFDEVNKTFRISPYQFRFKKLLFTDYNDYQSWQKDTFAAISIAPSLEEDKVIKDSWSLQQALPIQSIQEPGSGFFFEEEKNKTFLKRDDDTKQKLLMENLDVVQGEALQPKGKQTPPPSSIFSKKNENASLEYLHEQNKTLPEGEGGVPTKQENLVKKEKQKEDSVWSSEDRNAANLENPQEQFSDPSTIGEEDDKKKGVTKFEWLEQIREGDRLVEKRKDFQKKAYPNHEALVRKYLPSQPGKIQRLLVTDRKESFFGIANLFPKRLVAQDQKQIKHQLLREEQDQKVVSLLHCLYLKSSSLDPLSSFELDNSNHIIVEELLKSGALENLQKSNVFGYNRKRIERANRSPLIAPDTSPLEDQSKAGFSGGHGFQKGRDANQIASFNVLGRQELFSSLRTVPRNQENKNGTVAEGRGGYVTKTASHKASPSPSISVAPEASPLVNQSKASSPLGENSFSEQGPKGQLPQIVDLYKPPSFKKFRKLFTGRQQPIYTPNRRLRVRMPQSSLSLQNNNPQSRLDDLTLSQSHRWWQKRRIGSSLLGIPSKRYLVMPEIRAQDWKKIIEWQLKIYFLEEEKRVEPLFLEKKELQKPDRLRHLVVSGEQNLRPKDLFKIKKIAIYLPWTTLKKSLKKPFEWPITGLSYRSSLQFVQATKKQSFRQNKKARSCFVASIAPNFKSSGFVFSTFKFLPISESDTFGKMYAKKSFERGRFCEQIGQKKMQKQLHQTSVYKPFLFEKTPKNVALVLHSLALAVLLKQFLVGFSKGFGKLITQKIKNSSLGLALLPIFFNARSHKNQIPEFTHLKKRLNHLLSSEETISSLSELVWYLRNSCRGRMIPRGVILLETFSSETTAFLKAIGGEAQVPVIVQSLRGLPFTQSHPQRQFEKILQFAQKRSPCILFLDDLDSIGQSRTLLLKNNVYSPTLGSKGQAATPLRNEKEKIIFENKLYNFAGGNKETFEKRKWKKPKSDACFATQRFALSNGEANKKSFLVNSNTLQDRLTSKSKLVASSCTPFSKNKCLPLKLPFSKENETLHLSETEKIVEQRRVDLMLRLLTVMDGISHLKGVLIVTTSKNPTLLDPALLRPGRFEKLINLKLPNKKKRIELLKLEIQKIGYTNPMPWEYLGTQTQDMTGTEISSAINHSAFRAILQATVHTFSTLEYGISCAKGGPFSIDNSKKEKSIFGGVYKSPTCNVFYKTKTNPKKIHPLSSEIAFHQAGKGVVQGLFLYEPRASFWSLASRPTENALSIHEWENYREHPPAVTRLHFVRNIVQLYAGKASLSLYLDSISNFRNKVLGRSVQQPLFLESNLSSKEDLNASLIIASYLPFFNSSQNGGGKFLDSIAPRTNIGCARRTNLLCAVRAVRALHQRWRARSALQHPSKSKRARHLWWRARTCCKAELCTARSALQHLSKSKRARHLWWRARTCCKAELCTSRSALQKICKRFLSLSTRRGVKYHSIFPKNESKKLQIKKNLTLKTVRSHFQQTKRILTLSCLCKKSRNRYKKSYIFDSNNFLQHNLRKYFDFDITNEPTDSALVYDKTDNDLWWGEKTSEMVKIVKRPLGNWYRLYLPKLEENKNNREWLLPDQFFDQHAPLSKSCRFKKGTFSYYSIGLTCFYSAFQNCAQNRELLDFLSDHLIRFKILRLHEMMRIISFYL